jgi:hypothetical protein
MTAWVPRRVTWTALLLASVVSLAAAGCIPPRPSPSVSTAPPTATPTASAATTASPASGVIVDPMLLEVLPDAIDGVPVTADLETAADIAEEGSIAPFVSAIALATAFGPVATDQLGDYAVVTVAKLRQGTFSDLFFRGWRDTFDTGVCEQAGGVGPGTAETEIGGHQTFVGTCVGGVHTYHLYLPANDVIVSMQGVGPGRFAERIIAGITE